MILVIFSIWCLLTLKSFETTTEYPFSGVPSPKKYRIGVDDAYAPYAMWGYFKRNHETPTMISISIKLRIIVV